eukprot:scaffold12093_cov137-Isochrysis_galbana.AAC.11
MCHPLSALISTSLGADYGRSSLDGWRVDDQPSAGGAEGVPARLRFCIDSCILEMKVAVVVEPKKNLNRKRYTLAATRRNTI